MLQRADGFKYIAELIKEKEGQENYVIGGEESYGLMIGSQIRDKDAVSAVALLCEMAAYEKDKGRSLYDKLIDLLCTIRFLQGVRLSPSPKRAMNGQKEIAGMMSAYRDHPPVHINGSPVVQLLDYEIHTGKNLQTGEVWEIDLPKSNVLQFILADGSKISARPSGTEPKIKFYFSVHTVLPSAADHDRVNAEMGIRIDGIIGDMQLK